MSEDVVSLSLSPVQLQASILLAEARVSTATGTEKLHWQGLLDQLRASAEAPTSSAPVAAPRAVDVFYGELRLRKDAWLLKLNPDAAIAAKRMIPRLDKGEHGVLHLSDSLDNARALDWFCYRYPLRMIGKASEHLRERVKTHHQRERDVRKVLGPGYVPKEMKLAVPARQYQLVAAQLWLRSGVLLLADDVGLGKTVSSICGLTDKRLLPALIVTLTHLPEQWRDEINRFLPGLTIYIPKVATPEKGLDDLTKGPRGKRLPMPDVVVTSYSKISGWAGVLASYVKSVVYDEIQELRTGSGDKYRAAAHLREHVRFSCGLSATPIYNYGEEFYWVMSALSRDALGTRAEFLREWCGGRALDNDDSDDGEIARNSGKSSRCVTNPRAFGEYLRREGLMLRRTRAEVGRELPALDKVVQHVDADGSVLHEVENRAAHLARLILARGGAPEVKFRAAGEFDWRLRMATGIGKAGHVSEFVELLVESGEKVVLYGYHHAVYSIWANKLSRYKPAVYTGNQSQPQKREAKRRFIEGETPVLIIALRAGAGLDGLQYCGCRIVVFGELDWSPGVHEQACGRVHRDGQPDPVTAYFMLANSGSDPVIADTLGLKRSQIDGALRPDADDLVERLSVGEDHVRKLALDYLRRNDPGGLAELLKPTVIAASAEAANEVFEAEPEETEHGPYFDPASSQLTEGS